MHACMNVPSAHSCLYSLHEQMLLGSGTACSTGSQDKASGCVVRYCRTGTDRVGTWGAGVAAEKQSWTVHFSSRDRFRAPASLHETVLAPAKP